MEEPAAETSGLDPDAARPEHGGVVEQQVLGLALLHP